jgi:hypothetical protein
VLLVVVDVVAGGQEHGNGKAIKSDRHGQIQKLNRQSKYKDTAHEGDAQHAGLFDLI